MYHLIIISAIIVIQRQKKKIKDLYLFPRNCKAERYRIWSAKSERRYMIEFDKYIYYLKNMTYNLRKGTINFCMVSMVNKEMNKSHEIKIEEIEYITMGNYGDKPITSVGIESSFYDDQFELYINPIQYKCIVEDFGIKKMNDKKGRIFKHDPWINHSRNFNIFFDADEINFQCKAKKLYLDKEEILL